MFALLFTAALVAAERSEEDQSKHWVWMAGVLSALAFLTRTLGISLFIGIPLAFAIQRRFGAVWRFLVSGAVLAGGWPIWVRLHAGAADPKQLYYSWANYSSSNILMNYDVADKLRILTYNLIFFIASPATLFNLPAPIWFTPLLSILFFAVFVKRLVPANAAFLSLAAYIGIVLCWAWPPERFVAVVLPFVLFLTWRAMEALFANGWVRLGASVCAALLSCFVLANDVRSIPTIVSSGQLPTGPKSIDEWPELERVFAWIRLYAAENAIVLANIDPAIYLHTGRKSTRSNVEDSYKLFYSADAPTDDSVGSLDEILRVTNASYLVVTPDRAFAQVPVVGRALSRLLKTNPTRLELVDRPGADPEYRIYRVRP